MDLGILEIKGLESTSYNDVDLGRRVSLEQCRQERRDHDGVSETRRSEHDESHFDEWDVEISPEVVSILEQPFHYLAKGGQSYVFGSSDGKYVLKLFRFDACLLPYAREWGAKWAKWRGQKPRHFIPTMERAAKT